MRPVRAGGFSAARPVGIVLTLFVGLFWRHRSGGIVLAATERAAKKPPARTSCMHLEAALALAYHPQPLLEKRRGAF